MTPSVCGLILWSDQLYFVPDAVFNEPVTVPDLLFRHFGKRITSFSKTTVVSSASKMIEQDVSRHFDSANDWLNLPPAIIKSNFKFSDLRTNSHD